MTGRETVDLHSHLVPGVDDGARSKEEALEAIGQLADQGVGTIVTTPHLDASVIARQDVFARVQRVVETRWGEVVAAARDRWPNLRFGLGREIMLDTPVFSMEDPGVRMVGGAYILVEFPRLNIPPGSADALHRIRSAGRLPIVAHVERYHFDDDPWTTLDEWSAAGASLQVNLPSLQGLYGKGAAELAWQLLERGRAELLASDYHARGQPEIERVRLVVAERGGEEAWGVMTQVNPGRVLSGEALERPPAIGELRGRGLLDRVLRACAGLPRPSRGRFGPEY